MPILEPDSWRQQYFENYLCPEDVIIPTQDIDAYHLFPEYNWVYNKLLVAEKQNLPCGPHGTLPPKDCKYPIFSKPIYNLRGMGACIQIFKDEEEYLNSMKPGHMWSKLLVGEHWSSDVALVDGKLKWQCHTRGHALKDGTFDYWEIKENNFLNTRIQDFVEQLFSGYTGMMNLETIDGVIIEIHLRFADQWPDLYGDWFVPSLVNLYANKEFTVGLSKGNGYSVVLFNEPRQYKKPAPEVIDNLKKQFLNVTSIQLTFDEHVPFNSYSNPPGGYSVAVINGFDLNECKQLREKLFQIIC
ncbi:uncharacterized protein LOC136087394 [Hydra vulgaris]|uniref:Uncharacterized protein LOC136087394 n=1 Tax=Hydra vulgaris TaxID=6087 RepID=A0ABM4CW26_HYDVU